MARFVFRYDGNNRPRAEVTVCNGDKEIELAPIIDSGADITVIPKDIGEELNLSPPIASALNIRKFLHLIYSRELKAIYGNLILSLY